MSCYVIEAKGSSQRLPYLPLLMSLPSGRQVSLDHHKEQDVEQLFSIFKKIVEDGQSYPQEKMESLQDFRDYYLSHDVFVARDAAKTSEDVLGAFYVKPNFPGRSSHICNAGFIVKESERGQGLGKKMAERFLYIARDLGYKASFFNLVYVNNEASLRTWRGLGFKEIGIVPNAGFIKGLGYTDAVQFYYDFSTLTGSVEQLH
ncbi:uncharacterized protein LOC144864746 [Branchiostoma floridae x Branchiostoma japonicum]